MLFPIIIGRILSLEIIFVRHGESEANVLELMYGSSDYLLTARGKSQAKKAGEILRGMNYEPTAIYVSSLTRTHETLTHMGYAVEEAKKDQRLDERHLGDLEGLDYRVLHKEQPHLFKEWNENWLEYKPGGGETHVDFQKRIRSFLKDLEKNHTKEDRVLVVCHGGTMKTIFAEVFQHHENYFFSLEVYNCSLMRFKQGQKGLVLDALYNIDDWCKGEEESWTSKS